MVQTIAIIRNLSVVLVLERAVGEDAADAPPAGPKGSSARL